jgi:hypothetical protein
MVIPLFMTIPSDIVISLCITIPADMVIPLSIPMDMDIPDCMAEFIDEAAPVGAGELSQAIVTGGADGDIIGTMEVMVAEELCASAMGARAATAPIMVEERIARWVDVRDR